MTASQSIKFRLSFVFVFFFVLIFGFGLFSIDRLQEFNDVSANVRDRWLPDTQFLGDLNNYTSDFRAAEGSRLAASTPDQVAANAQEIRELDMQIASAIRSYEHVRHDATEWKLYAAFKGYWSRYRAVASEVLGLAAANHSAAAAATYMTTSRVAYARASDSLGELTSVNNARARQANQQADLAYREAVSLTSCAILFAALMVAAAVIYIRRSISEPLLDLAACMRAVAQDPANAPIHGIERGDEVGEMARAVVVFRNNAIDLAVSQQGLAQQAAMLQEKLEQERRLTQLQRNFVSMASHEFRTPLTIIDGHAQRLLSRPESLSPSDIVERARKIRGAVLRMTNLINGLLGSSLLDGKVELYFHPEEFDLLQLLHEVARVHREISPQSQIYIRPEGNAPILVMADRKLLFQVISNLLSNAVKYSPNGGLIKITAQDSAGFAVVKVTDQGLGIPAADLDRLFERYYRGRNVSGIVGTGIGLYFVKTVVELHGGEISVQSVEGKGATFALKLPLAHAAPHQPSEFPAPTASRNVEPALEDSGTART